MRHSQRRYITDVGGFSDASSTTGVGIVVSDKWRAWRLLPSWKSGGRDIGWAEAVAMELLIRSILNASSYQGIQVYGDNTGVVEGWWSGRSRNAETNRVFKRIHYLLDGHGAVLKTKYVNTRNNPADGPSRGVFSPTHLRLPPVEIPDDVKPYIIDFDAPTHPSEDPTTQHLASSPKAAVSPLKFIR